MGVSAPESVYNYLYVWNEAVLPNHKNATTFQFIYMAIGIDIMDVCQSWLYIAITFVHKLDMCPHGCVCPWGC